jgi:hypothetical protein
MQRDQYHALKTGLAAALDRDRHAQLSGEIGAIGNGYEDLDGRIPRDGTAESARLLEAMCFWDYWIDARNHAWTPFYGIEEKSWPLLAHHVVYALKSDQSITDPAVLQLVR